MTETQQRFLRAIAERVPSEQVVEVRLFPPIRQGGVETGVAVVAEDPRKRMADSDPVTVAANGTAEVASAQPAQHGEDESQAAPVVDAVEDVHVAEIDLAHVDVADEEVAGPHVAEADATEVETVAADVDDEVEAMEPLRSRFTIHTARYRLTLKGVDRGKWEVDVVAEADAPLDAVEAVVRGVQRRSGEGAEPDRLTTDAFREALDAPLAQLER